MTYVEKKHHNLGSDHFFWVMVFICLYCIVSPLKFGLDSRHGWCLCPSRLHPQFDILLLQDWCWMVSNHFLLLKGCKHLVMLDCGAGILGLLPGVCWVGFIECAIVDPGPRIPPCPFLSLEPAPSHSTSSHWASSDSVCHPLSFPVLM